MIRRLALALAALVAACQSTQQAPVAPAFTLRDLTGNYVAFYDRTGEMAPQERVAAFKAEVGQTLPSYYSVARVGEFGVTPERYDQMIQRSFERFPTIRDRFLSTSAQFNAMLTPAHASFARAFPDIGSIGEIYLLHSLGEMDGGTRTLDGQVRLVFGADGIVADNFANAQPFFHHELFHVYHGRSFEECDEVWCNLWSEGLAVHVAQALNPDATEGELLLNSPVPLRPFVEAHQSEVICAIASRLHSTTDSQLLFMGGRSLEGMPARVGYAAGYLVARQAASTRTLAQLAHLSQAEAFPLVEASLAALATCPSAAN